MPPTTPIDLELREPPSALLDEPMIARAGRAGGEEVLWRARYRDDDDRVWRAAAARAEDLSAAWAPAKAGTGGIAALRSLRPVRIDLRVETADGRAASRTLTRRIAGEGVRSRRWRDGLSATLALPAETPRATLVVDAAGGDVQAAVAALAAPLLASRGVLALVVAGEAETARERLAAVPGASSDVRVLGVADPFGAAPEPGAAVVLPPNVGARDEDPGAALARAAAWDALLAELGATPRVSPAT